MIAISNYSEDTTLIILINKFFGMSKFHFFTYYSLSFTLILWQSGQNRVYCIGTIYKIIQLYLMHLNHINQHNIYLWLSTITKNNKELKKLSFVGTWLFFLKILGLEISGSINSIPNYRFPSALSKPHPIGLRKFNAEQLIIVMHVYIYQYYISCEINKIYYT